LARLPELVRALEEPIFLGAVLPTDQVCGLAAESVKTVLTGEGADEIFAGYRKFLLEMAALRYPEAPAAEKRELLADFPELAGYLARRAADPLARYIQSEALFSPPELARLLRRPASEMEISGLAALAAAPKLLGREHPLNAALAVESRCRLPDYVILRLDKLSMRHSLETRTPFLDYRLAEFAARLPVDFKIKLAARREKYICRRSFSAGGLLDETTAWRRKQPFTSPLAAWLADPALWPEPVAEALRGGMIARQGIFDPVVTDDLARRVTAAGIGPATLVSDADRLFAILVFTLWYEEFGSGKV
jgi:asparagine synthase (glutamine-hydrolysing)